MHDPLALASSSRPWSLLIRHAERPEIPAGTFGSALSITESGRADAITLGQVLGARLGRLVSSPVLRCVQTAKAIRDGAGGHGSMSQDRVLGDPGVWIDDGAAVGGIFLKFGAQAVVERQVTGRAIPGMAPLRAGVTRFLELLLSEAGEAGTVDVYVSHDAVIAPLLAALLDRQDVTEIWPAYLEGALLSTGADGLDVIWRGDVHASHWRLL